MRYINSKKIVFNNKPNYKDLGIYTFLDENESLNYFESDSVPIKYDKFIGKDLYSFSVGHNVNEAIMDSKIQTMVNPYDIVNNPTGISPLKYEGNTMVQINSLNIVNRGVNSRINDVYFRFFLFSKAFFNPFYDNGRVKNYSKLQAGIEGIGSEEGATDDFHTFKVDLRSPAMFYAQNGPNYGEGGAPGNFGALQNLIVVENFDVVNNPYSSGRLATSPDFANKRSTFEPALSLRKIGSRPTYFSDTGDFGVLPAMGHDEELTTLFQEDSAAGDNPYYFAIHMDGDMNPKHSGDRSRDQTISIYEFDPLQLFENGAGKSTSLEWNNPTAEVTSNDQSYNAAFSGKELRMTIDTSGGVNQSNYNPPPEYKENGFTRRIIQPIPRTAGQPNEITDYQILNMFPEREIRLDLSPTYNQGSLVESHFGIFGDWIPISEAQVSNQDIQVYYQNDDDRIIASAPNTIELNHFISLHPKPKTRLDSIAGYSEFDIYELKKIGVTGNSNGDLFIDSAGNEVEQIPGLMSTVDGWENQSSISNSTFRGFGFGNSWSSRNYLEFPIPNNQFEYNPFDQFHGPGKEAFQNSTLAQEDLLVFPNDFYLNFKDELLQHLSLTGNYSDGFTINGADEIIGKYWISIFSDNRDYGSTGLESKEWFKIIDIGYKNYGAEGSLSAGIQEPQYWIFRVDKGLFSPILTENPLQEYQDLTGPGNNPLNTYYYYSTNELIELWKFKETINTAIVETEQFVLGNSITNFFGINDNIGFELKDRDDGNGYTANYYLDGDSDNVADQEFSYSSETFYGINYKHLVISWDDVDNRYETIDDALADWPRTKLELLEKRNENLYHLRDIKEKLKHSYTTPGMKTIKSIVFSESLIFEPIRWKLVTTNIFLDLPISEFPDFSELGGVDYTTIPWPYTTAVINGLSENSKYQTSIDNLLSSGKIGNQDTIDETFLVNAQDNDELGKNIEKLDLEQVRYFNDSYDMNQLLNIESSVSLGLTPYQDITIDKFFGLFDTGTESDTLGYWKVITYEPFNNNEVTSDDTITNPSLLLLIKQLFFKVTKVNGDGTKETLGTWIPSPASPGEGNWDIHTTDVLITPSTEFEIEILSYSEYEDIYLEDESMIYSNPDDIFGTYSNAFSVKLQFYHPMLINYSEYLESQNIPFTDVTIGDDFFEINLIEGSNGYYTSEIMLPEDSYFEAPTFYYPTSDQMTFKSGFGTNPTDAPDIEFTESQEEQYGGITEWDIREQATGHMKFQYDTLGIFQSKYYEEQDYDALYPMYGYTPTLINPETGTEQSGPFVDFRESLQYDTINGFQMAMFYGWQPSGNHSSFWKSSGGPGAASMIPATVVDGELSTTYDMGVREIDIRDWCRVTRGETYDSSDLQNHPCLNGGHLLAQFKGNMYETANRFCYQAGYSGGVYPNSVEGSYMNFNIPGADQQEYDTAEEHPSFTINAIYYCGDYGQYCEDFDYYGPVGLGNMSYEDQYSDFLSESGQTGGTDADEFQYTAPSSDSDKDTFEWRFKFSGVPFTGHGGPSLNYRGQPFIYRLTCSGQLLVYPDGLERRTPLPIKFRTRDYSPDAPQDNFFRPYYDFNYWNALSPERTFPKNSSIGQIFIDNLQNKNVRQSCKVELNTGDISDKSILDSTGNANKGLLMGDYKIKKLRKNEPMRRDSFIKVPNKNNNEDGAL